MTAPVVRGGRPTYREMFRPLLPLARHGGGIRPLQSRLRRPGGKGEGRRPWHTCREMRAGMGLARSPAAVMYATSRAATCGRQGAVRGRLEGAAAYLFVCRTAVA